MTSRRQVEHFLTSISHMLLNFVLVWIGMTMVYKVDHVFGLFSWVTFGLSMFGRLVSVVVISVVVNLIPGNASDNIAIRDAVMLFCSGIRGPTALALVYQFPSSLREVPGLPAPSIAQPDHHGYAARQFLPRGTAVYRALLALRFSASSSPTLSLAASPRAWSAAVHHHVHRPADQFLDNACSNPTPWPVV